MAGIADACYGAGYSKDFIDAIPLFIRFENGIAPKDHSYKPVLQKVRNYNYYFNGEDDRQLLYHFNNYAYPHLGKSPIGHDNQSLSQSLGHSIGKPMLFLAIHEGIGKLSEVDSNGQRVRAGNDTTKLIAAGALTETVCIVIPELFSQDDHKVTMARADQKMNAVAKKVVIAGAHKILQPYTDSFIEKRVGEGFTREVLKCAANIATMQVISMGVNACTQK